MKDHSPVWEALPPPMELDGIVLTRGSDIEPVPISWLWHHWLARGKLHILAGAPGAGKTTIALGLAATLTSGGRWPDGVRCEPGNVLIWSGEDDPADTLVPRLIGMGANMDRIYFVTGSRIDDEVLPFDPARELLELSIEAQRIGDIKLLIVDPVVSAVSGDSHKNAEVRKGLQPLVNLGAELGAAVVGITHLSKGTVGRDPTERVTGSIAFSAVARIVLLAAKVRNEEGGDKRMLVRSKANIAPDDGGFEYHVEQVEAQGIPTSIVTWGQAVAGNARDLLAEPEDEGSDAAGARQSAEDFLRELLICATPTKTVQAEAKEAGHSWSTVRRASDALNVVKKKGDSGWYWQLPVYARKGGNLLTKKHGQVGQHEHVEQDETLQVAQGAQLAHVLKGEEAEQLGADEVQL